MYLIFVQLILISFHAFFNDVYMPEIGQYIALQFSRIKLLYKRLYGILTLHICDVQSNVMSLGKGGLYSFLKNRTLYRTWDCQDSPAKTDPFKGDGVSGGQQGPCAC